MEPEPHGGPVSPETIIIAVAGILAIVAFVIFCL